MSTSDDVHKLRERLGRAFDHAYIELCPDAVNGFDSRDPECPACQQLERLLDVPDAIVSLGADGLANA